MRAPLYLTEQGSVLSQRGRRLLVRKGGDELAQIPLVQVSQVVIFGNVSITTPALQLLLREGIETTLLSRSGRFYGRLVGLPHGNGPLRVAQVLHSQDAGFMLGLARQFVRGKLHNLRVLLQRYARRTTATGLDAAVTGIGAMLAQVERCHTTNSLSGVEGRATAIYFGAWKQLLQPPWRFEKRVRRPPTDPVNVLLSFGYTLLTQNVLSAVLTAGLDPNVGFLHQLSYNRPSLALDLVEEFRPVVVDSVVLRCMNNQILTPEHFEAGEDEDRPVVLTQEGIRRFVRELESRFEQSFKHPADGEQLTYRRLFLRQAYQLARILQGRGKAEAYQPFLIR